MFKKLFVLTLFAIMAMAIPVEADTLSGLADVTVVDDAIVSLRYEGTEYVVADGDLMLGSTTRWYIPADTGIPTLWLEGDPAPPATVSGTSNPKAGDVGSKADNFLFKLNGSTNISSIDGIDFQETLFPVPTDTFFVFERGGNDTGTYQAILVDGTLGEEVSFSKAPYANTGINVNGQDAHGVVFTTDVPVLGVRITASGHDTLSLSAPKLPVDPGTENLVALYAMENDVNDSSVNALHGTAVGGPSFVESLAGYGMALDFDGVDDVVELGAFDVNGLITMAAWIKADDFEINDARIITKAQEWGGNDHWWMMSTISETSLRFRLKTDDGEDTATLISDPVLEAGTWAHVAATWDGAMMRIYKDGVEVASQEKGGLAVAMDSNVSVAIGSQPSDAFASDPGHVVKFFDGLIDEVYIYERALTENELLYLAGFRENLVLNPSFEADEAILDDPDWLQWATWNPAEGAGSNAGIVDTDSIDGVRSLRIEPKGIANWHFIVLYLPIMVDMDKNYDVCFWAKAEEPRPLTVQIKATDNSINAWGATDFELTTEWAEYTFTSDVLIDNVKLEILCSGTEVPFWLDLVSFTEGK